MLPAIGGRLRPAVLVAPCNWGPLAVSRQLPVFHDAAPLFHPELFERSYVAWTRARRSLTLVYDPGAPSPFLLEAFDAAELTGSQA